MESSERSEAPAQRRRELGRATSVTRNKRSCQAGGNVLSANLRKSREPKKGADSEQEPSKIGHNEAKSEVIDVRWFGGFRNNADIQHRQETVHSIYSWNRHRPVVVYGVARVGQDACNIFDIGAICPIFRGGLSTERHSVGEVSTLYWRASDVANEPVSVETMSNSRSEGGSSRTFRGCSRWG